MSVLAAPALSALVERLRDANASRRPLCLRGGGSKDFYGEKPHGDQLHRAEAFGAEILDLSVAMGGTVTGEHGTGLAKKRWLELQRGARAVEAMRSIKQALDPSGLLNPGKVF